MESVLFGLAFLACPVGMGAMMWFMARGRRGKRKEEPSASLEGMREEHRRLAAEIERVEGRDRDLSGARR
jgi:hypothetical protein